VFIADVQPNITDLQRGILSNLFCDLAQKVHFGGGCGIMNVLEGIVLCQKALPIESEVKIQNYQDLISC
jgi:hypothetical protein